MDKRVSVLGVALSVVVAVSGGAIAEEGAGVSNLVAKGRSAGGGDCATQLPKVVESVDPFAPRVDTIHDGQEYVKVMDAADFSNMVRSAVVDASVAIPKLGVFVSIYLDNVWESEDPTEPLLGMLYKDAAEMIRNALTAEERERVLGKLRTLRDHLDSYRRNPTTENFVRAYEKSKDTAHDLSNNINAPRLYPLVVFVYTVHMFMHKERVANFERLYPEGSPSDKEGYIKDFVIDYAAFRDKLFVARGSGGAPLYDEFMSYRMGMIDRSHGWDEDAGVVSPDCYGSVNDRMYGWRIRYSQDYLSCANGGNEFAESVQNVVNLLMSKTRLDAAKVSSSAFYLSRLLPEGALRSHGAALGVNYTDAEARSSGAFYLPEKLKTIEVGPIGRSCLVFGEADSAKGGGYTVECNAPGRDAIEFSKPVESVKYFEQRYEAFNYDYGGFDQVVGLRLFTDHQKPGEAFKSLGGTASTTYQHDLPEGYVLIGFEDIAQRRVEKTGLFDRDSVWPVDGQLIGLTPVYSRRDGCNAYYIRKPINKNGGYSKFRDMKKTYFSSVGSVDYPLTALTAARNPHDVDSSPNFYYMWQTFSFSPSK